MASEYKDVAELTAEDQSDFSGNYIEKFEGKQTKDHFPSQCVDWEKIGQKFYFHSENCTLEVSVITNEILKFRHGNDGYFEDDFSYAISETYQAEEVNISFKERQTYFAIHTEKIKCYIYKENLKLRLLNLDGKVILEDEKGYHWQEENTFGGDVVISTKKIKNNESFYGLGDKTGNLNLRGTRKELWGTDCYGYGNETDPVYKNIPFYLGQIEKASYGIFLDNSFRSYFDFGSERKNVASFWAQGGEMRYYFIYGPDPMDVVTRYTELTGKASLPPMWALGYHQSKWSYYPESVVRSLAKEFRDRKIPCDVIHLDIDYMDGFRCFTWDKERFPNPEKMTAELKEQGFRTVVIIDPGIKIDKKYSVYVEAMEKNYFCRRGDGPLLKGSVWPGLCHFPDFTNPKARKWWAGLFKNFVDSGISGVWNDMNEPAMFEQGTFPLDVRHDYDSHPCTHRKGHNVYGSLMAKSTNQGLKKSKKNKRPFTITRSAYAGIQQHACVWTGDNVASWEHLRIANIQCQRLSTSGISFAGSDVGGFIGTPSAELYTRWVQMAVFHP
ncbi:MAG: TIM-barrel domain-containing protein, partial [Bacteroidota bacterium]